MINPTTNTIFLKIYCPKSVQQNGALVKDNSGKKNSGVNVPAICISPRILAHLGLKPITRAMPRAASQVAKALYVIP